MSAVVVSTPSGFDLVDSVKVLADLHRDELGFHTRRVYVESVERRELAIATSGRRVVGFVRYHKRRDTAATIYEIVVSAECRNRGVGRQLLAHVVNECRRVDARILQLTCPAELQSNA